jgi:hypothetical protein
MAEFDLAQWFDLTKPIGRADRWAVEDKITLWFYKDEKRMPCERRCKHPECKRWRLAIAGMRHSIREHKRKRRMNDE